METNCSFHVSRKNYANKVMEKLKIFVSYFVKEFENKLLIYHLILEGELKKAGKFSDTFSELLGQSAGVAMGGLIGLVLGAPVTGASLGAKAGETGGRKLNNFANKHYRKQVIKLLDLIELFQNDKAGFRRILVEAACDLFHSFEMQFMRVQTNQSEQKAIQYLAKDATNRAINYLKQRKTDIISISESAVLGESKKTGLYKFNPGFKVRYQYESCRKVWNTASLYAKSGIVVIENDIVIGYYRVKNESSKYGYRRLLLNEHFDELSAKYILDNTVESRNGQFTDYQYVTNRDSMVEQSDRILEQLNGEDPNLGEARIRKLLKTVRKDILNEVEILKNQSRDNSEDHAILVRLEHRIKHLNLNEYLEKFREKLDKIEWSIEQSRQESRENHLKTQQSIDELKQRLDRFQTDHEQIVIESSLIKHYYITRTLNRLIEIKDGFKDEPAKFYVTYTAEFDRSQFQTGKDLILISEYQTDFDKLSMEYHKTNIHWIKEKSGNRFIWQCSSGSMSEIRRFLNDLRVERVQINRISTIKDRIVIIAAGPGMGKSTLLNHLAIEQKMISKSLKVIQINLNDCTERLAAEINFETINEIVEFLQFEHETDLQRSILLFDGFDEIASNGDYKNKILKLIKCLKNAQVRFWITTRPYAQFDLEDELSVFSYSLEPLPELVQQEFLQKFWKTNFLYDFIKVLTLKIRAELEDDLIQKLADQIFRIIQLEIVDSNLERIQMITKQFDLSKKFESVQMILNIIDQQLGKERCCQISKSIQELGEELYDLDEIKDLIQTRSKQFGAELIREFSESVSDRERQFTGVPLQVRMLAEAFQEEFYADFKCFYSLEPDERILDKPRLPRRLNLLDLYERFIESKYRIHFVEKGNMDLTNVVMLKQYKSTLAIFIQEHRLLALNLLFGEDDLRRLLSDQDKDKVKQLKEHIGDGTENSGIVYKIVDGKPHFIHRTFAEYFTADFFIGTKFKLIRDFLIEHLFKAENAVIRHFFDSMLIKDDQGKRLEIHSAVLDNDRRKIRELLSNPGTAGRHMIDSVDKGGRTALHLAAAYGYSYLVRVLLENGANISIKDKIFTWRPLNYADKGNYWDIVELLLEEGDKGNGIFEAKHQINTQNYKNETTTTLLHLAAERDFQEFTKLLVEKLKADPRVTDRCRRIPLHLAAAYGNLEIVKFLVNKDPRSERMKDINGRTPLNLAVIRGQLDVIRFLSKESELTRRELDELQLNTAASNGDYDMVRRLLKKGVNANCEVLNRKPLEQAMLKDNRSVMKLLVENGAKIGF